MNTDPAYLPNWTALVLLSRQRRVRHIAVWSNVNEPPGPICRNRGDFPNFGALHQFPGIPICVRCADEVRLLADSIRSAE